MTFLSSLAAATAILFQAASGQLPEQLRCDLSGEAGCGTGPGGVCVGSGITDKNITMTIQTIKRRVLLNAIGGRIEGVGPLKFGEKQAVFWRPRLIALSSIYVRPERDFHDRSGAPYIVVELTNPTELVEFECRAA